MRLDRRTVLSVLFGVGAAALLSRVGYFGVPIVILSFPLVFRRVERAAPDQLLAAFGVTWLVLCWVVAPIVLGAASDAWPVGVVALIGAAVFAVVFRLREGRPDGMPRVGP